MEENADHSTLNLTAYRYVPINRKLLRVPLEDALITVEHHIMEEYYTVVCSCGLWSVIADWQYVIGLPHNGGEEPKEGTIGVIFGPGHRWIRLYCSGCAQSQWYFREDELGHNNG